jgi:hypothetical protein
MRGVVAAIWRSCRIYVRSYSELTFQDAAATIRRTGQDFEYQLDVQRVYEKGEEDILAEEAGEDAGTGGLGGKVWKVQ